VNLGFAIYDPDFEIVAQTQAMPGYINVLRYTFTEPGTYPAYIAQTIASRFCALFGVVRYRLQNLSRAKSCPIGLLVATSLPSCQAH
jgi:hypothetical protein